MSDAVAQLGARPPATGHADAARSREPLREREAGAEHAPAFAALLNAALQPQPRPRAEAQPADGAETELSTEDTPVEGEAGTPVEAPPTGLSALGAGLSAGAARGMARKEAEATEASGSIPPLHPSASSASLQSAAAAEGEEPSAESAASPTATAVDRGLDGLVPEMRDRLARVMERMRSEHGHDVRVVETVRSQARQDQLHAQGRSAPGPVVTWTRRSNHTSGRAADVVVNGTYDDPRAYAALQHIAQEEGLRTLGARDAGHLELPAQVAGRGTPDGRAAADALPVTAARVERVEIANAPAVQRMAPVAAVAQVAQVAQVARVARVATPGAAGRTAGATPGAHGRETALAHGGRVAATEARGARGPLRGELARDAEQGGGEAASAELLAGYGGEEQAHGYGGGEGRGTALAGAVRGAEAAQDVAGADPLARLDRIEALREGAAARPLSHITLRLDGADGTQDRIRVDLRGNALGATLDLSDAALAERVGARIGELRHALERQGLETDALHVRRSAAAVPEAIETGRVASVLLEREAARSGANSSHTGGSAAQQQQHAGSSPRERDDRPSRDPSQGDASDSRHHSRREPKGGR